MLPWQTYSPSLIVMKTILIFQKIFQSFPGRAANYDAQAHDGENLSHFFQACDLIPVHHFEARVRTGDVDVIMNRTLNHPSWGLFTAAPTTHA